MHRHGKELFVDVRVSWDDPSRNSRENGQDYPALLEHADRLVVWDYFGLNDTEPGYTAELAAHLRRLGGADRFIMSVGLWAAGDTSIPAPDMGTALAASADSGIPDTWVTPLGRLDDDHWNALREHWR